MATAQDIQTLRVIRTGTIREMVSLAQTESAKIQGLLVIVSQRVAGQDAPDPQEGDTFEEVCFRLHMMILSCEERAKSVDETVHPSELAALLQATLTFQQIRADMQRAKEDLRDLVGQGLLSRMIGGMVSGGCGDPNCESCGQDAPHDPDGMVH
mgnify:CR=1 FL=1